MKSAAQRSLQEHKHGLTPAPAPAALHLIQSWSSPLSESITGPEHHRTSPLVHAPTMIQNHCFWRRSWPSVHIYTMTHTHTHTHTHTLSLSLSHTHNTHTLLFISVIFTIIIRSLTGVCPFLADDSRSADRTGWFRFICLIGSDHFWWFGSFLTIRISSDSSVWSVRIISDDSDQFRFICLIGSDHFWWFGSVLIHLFVRFGSFLLVWIGSDSSVIGSDHFWRFGSVPIHLFDQFGSFLMVRIGSDSSFCSVRIISVGSEFGSIPILLFDRFG